MKSKYTIKIVIFIIITININNIVFADIFRTERFIKQLEFTQYFSLINYDIKSENVDFCDYYDYKFIINNIKCYRIGYKNSLNNIFIAGNRKLLNNNMTEKEISKYNFIVLVMPHDEIQLASLTFNSELKQLIKSIDIEFENNTSVVRIYYNEKPKRFCCGNTIFSYSVIVTNNSNKIALSYTGNIVFKKYPWDAKIDIDNSVIEDIRKTSSTIISSNNTIEYKYNNQDCNFSDNKNYYITIILGNCNGILSCYLNPDKKEIEYNLAIIRE